MGKEAIKQKEQLSPDEITSVAFEDMPSLMLMLCREVSQLRQQVASFSNTADDQPNELMNISQAAALLDLTVPYIYQLVNKKVIPYHKAANGQRLRFMRSELVAWSQNRNGV